MEMKFAQISKASVKKNTIAATIVEFKECKTKKCEKFGKYLLKQQKSKITALAFAETYTLLKHFLKVNDDKVIKFPPGTFSCRARNVKYPSHSTSKNELIFLQTSPFIEETKATPGSSSSVVGNADNEYSSVHKVSQLQATETFTSKLKLIKFSGGEVHRYWGCEACSFSIRTKHSDGKYYCKGMCNKKQKQKSKSTNGVQRKRKICFTINKVIISNDKDEKIESVVIFNRVCESLFKENGDDFNTDNDAEIAWKKLITTFCFNITLTRNKKKKGSAYTPAIHVEMVDDIRVPFSTRTEPEPVIELESDVESESDAESESGLEPSYDKENEFNGAEKKRKKIPNFAKYEMTLQYRSDKHEDSVTKYRITSKPRGMALLINNYNFPDCENKERRGSEKDIDAIKVFFEKVEFEIYGNKCYLDIKTAKEFGNLIESFKKELIATNVDSMMIVISSHGSSNQVSLSNSNQCICVVEDLMIPFSDEKFPEFQGKPKVFMPLACQTLRNTASGRPLDFLCNKLFDMLVICPCLPGYAQKRFPPIYGSLFVNYLMKNFMKYATSWHLVAILDKVQEDFKKEIKKSKLTSITVPHYIKSTFGEFRLARGLADNTDDMNMQID